MADATHIEWTDATWNPVTGCSVVSPGCTNCYAMRLAGTRLQHHPSRAGLTQPSKAGPVWNGKVQLNTEWLDQPLRWRRPRRIFVCAHGDLFHDSVPDAWIDQVFAVMALAPHHTFQVLTKRADRMRAYVAAMTHQRMADAIPCPSNMAMSYAEMHHRLLGWASNLYRLPEGQRPPLPLPNVWLGVSAEDQTRADERIPDLLDTPAAVRFVSLEPLLGPVDLDRIHTRTFDRTFGDGNGVEIHDWWSALNGRRLNDNMDGEDEGFPRLDWVIVGGESGPGARPMHPDWVRPIRDACAAAGVAFFFKQWGMALPWEPDDASDGAPWRSQAGSVCTLRDLCKWADFRSGPIFTHVGKAAAGRLLDGVEHSAMPEDPAPC